MSNPFTLNLNLNGNMGVGLNGMVALDVGLDDIGITFKKPIEIKADTNSTVDLGLDDIGITLGVRATRVHFPVNYHMCFALFGKEVVKLGLCGESMVITEPYLPHHTESCG